MASRQISLNRRILRLALPNIITNITVPLLGMADFALMGHLKQESALYVGAIALGSTIFNVIYMSFAFLRMGTSGFTAQAYGARNNEKMALALQRAVLTGLLFSLLLILSQYPIQWVAFRLLKGGEEVKHLARQYFYIRIYAAPATLMLYGFYGWFLGMQNAKFPMIVAVTVNALNIGLNFLFVSGFHMKSDGVALATVIAQYTGLLLALIFAVLFYKPYTLPRKFARIIRWKELSVFFKVNGDIFIRTLLLILTIAFFTGTSARFGDNVLAVNSILFQLFFIFSYFADGFAYAGEALTGKALGSGDKLLLKKTVYGLFRWGWGIAIISSLAYAAGFPLLMKLMTNNPELLTLSRTYALWVILLPLFSVAAFIWDGVYVGVTASKAMRNTMIIASLFVFLPVYYLTVNRLGNHALWLAMELFMLTRGVSMWVMAKKAGYWM